MLDGLWTYFNCTKGYIFKKFEPDYIFIFCVSSDFFLPKGLFFPCLALEVFPAVGQSILSVASFQCGKDWGRVLLLQAAVGMVLRSRRPGVPLPSVRCSF